MEDVFKVQTPIRDRPDDGQREPILECYVEKIDVAGSTIVREYSPQYYSYDYVIMTDCYVGPDGIILKDGKHYYILDQAIKTVRVKQGPSISVRDVPVLDEVVSISSVWASGIFHYPFDCLTRLCALENMGFRDKIIHTGYMNKYISQWNTILGIRNTVSGRSFARD